MLHTSLEPHGISAQAPHPQALQHGFPIRGSELLVSSCGPMKKTKGMHLEEIFLNLVLKMETVKDWGRETVGTIRGGGLCELREDFHGRAWLLILTTLKFL